MQPGWSWGNLKELALHQSSASSLAPHFCPSWIQNHNTSLLSLWWNTSTLLIIRPEHLPAFPFSQIEWRKASESTKDKSKILRLSLFQLPSPHCLELTSIWSATISFPFVLQIKPKNLPVSKILPCWHFSLIKLCSCTCPVLFIVRAFECVCCTALSWMPRHRDSL